MAGSPTAAGEPHARGLQALHPRHWLLRSWQRIDAQAEAERAQRAGYDYRPLVAYGLGALCLWALDTFGPAWAFREWLDALVAHFGAGPALLWLRDGPFAELMACLFWSGTRVLCYFALPALLVRAVFREPLRDYGLRVAGLREHAVLYASLGLGTLLVVALVSARPEFQAQYPLYGEAGRSWVDLLGWELAYAAQFFALEFFFRGFLLHACRERFGSAAIFAMLAPYCMIHFGKPWPEVLASLPAGLVLGTLALSTRSIASGVLLHVTVALGMDLMALSHRGSLPATLWPG